MLVHTDVVKYLEFKAVDGSFVLNKGRVEKVPATDYEALRSPLMGLFEKRRARSFFMCALSPRRSAHLLETIIKSNLSLQACMPQTCIFMQLVHVMFQHSPPCFSTDIEVSSAHMHAIIACRDAETHGA